MAIAAASQITTIVIAAARLFGRVVCRSAFSLRSAITSPGTSRTASNMPSGKRIASSRYPSTGMKSGIRSIGLRAYATTKAATTFGLDAAHGDVVKQMLVESQQMGTLPLPVEPDGKSRWSD